MLFGREKELARIERLLDDARAGTSGVLVLRGEAGIGKTELLRAAIQRADSMTVLRATGIEAEAELEFSGLLELVRSELGRLEDLTEHQGAALRGALGLAPAGSTDRFAVGAATLALLAAVAEAAPLLVLADDAQWLDRASADALCFAARRMDADRAAFLFAVRDGDVRTFDAAGFEQLELAGLDDDTASKLLAHAAGVEVEAHVARRLRTATAGNPLALLELPNLLSEEQLAGDAPVTGPVPAGERIREAFAARALALPEAAHKALLLVSASTDDRMETIAASLKAAGLRESALELAEDEGLLEIADGRVRFRHPLVRAAVYESAEPSERRAVHRALAEGDGEAERRAWHLAEASIGPDESVAAALAEAAAQARARTGHIAAAIAFERSAMLTPDREARSLRLAEAAEAARAGGDTARALLLVDAALLEADAAVRARLLLLAGRIDSQMGLLAQAYERLVDAASLVEETDPTLAADALCEAAITCTFAGRIADGVDAARRARKLAPRDGSGIDVVADYVQGRLLLMAGMGDEGRAPLERAASSLLDDGAATPLRLARACIALAELERDAEAREAADRAVELARGRHPVALALALSTQAHHDTWTGRWKRATGTWLEALELERDLGYRNGAAHCLVELARIDAARGLEDSCRARIAEVQALTEDLPLESVRLASQLVLGQLALALGRLDEAASLLAPVSDRMEELGICDPDIAAEPDLVELYAALGRQEQARTYHARWLERGARGSPSWGPALAARCEGILAGEDAFDEPFERALGLHTEVMDAFAEARTLLSYGERLRRAGRKTDSRERLRAAFALFEELEATPWAERARRELRATGEKLRRRRAETGDELTPQELQVALQVAEGKTNKEVGAALFLSPKTVEFHLARVFRKLELASRAEVIRHFAAEKASVT